VRGSDDSGEFRSDAFTNVLAEMNIDMGYVQPDTPLQNTKIERFWGTQETPTDRSRDRGEKSPRA
jgi:transposase InsO family protein